MNGYDALLSGTPLDEKQTAIMAAKLRGQDDRAILATLSGDKVLGQVGQLESNASANMASGLSKAKQAQLRRQEQQADRASQDQRHAETQARLEAQAEAQRELMRDQMELGRQRHEDMMRFREDGQDLAERKLTQATELAETKATAKADKETNNNARRLSTKLVDEGITDLEASFETADKVVGKYFNPNTGERVEGVTDIPGYGGIANNLPTVMLSQEGKELRNHLAGVRNRILKARSGAAVTDPEMARLAEELGTALGGTEQDMINAYVNLKKATARVKSGIYAGFAPDVQDRYDQQFATHRGVVPSSDQKIQQRAQGALAAPGGSAYEVID